MADVIKLNSSLLLVVDVDSHEVNEENLRSSFVSSKDPLPYDPMLGWYTAATLSGLLMLFILCVVLEKLKDKVLAFFEARTNVEDEFKSYNFSPEKLSTDEACTVLKDQQLLDDSKEKSGCINFSDNSTFKSFPSSFLKKDGVKSRPDCLLTSSCPNIGKENPSLSSNRKSVSLQFLTVFNTVSLMSNCQGTLVEFLMA